MLPEVQGYWQHARALLNDIVDRAWLVVEFLVLLEETQVQAEHIARTNEILPHISQGHRS